MKENDCKADLHIKQSGSTIFLNVCVGVIWWLWVGGGGAVMQQSHKHIWSSLQCQSCRVTPAGRKHSSQCLKWIWWKPSFSAAHYSGWWTVHCLRWLKTSARTWSFTFSSFDNQLRRNSGEYFREEEKGKKADTNHIRPLILAQLTLLGNSLQPWFIVWPLINWVV